MTAILDSIGMALYQPYISTVPGGFDTDNSIVSYLFTFWGRLDSEIQSGSSLPFWSLNHEAWYFILSYLPASHIFQANGGVLLLLAACGAQDFIAVPSLADGGGGVAYKGCDPQRLGPVLAALSGTIERR